jgi:FkbM family methyltransferase
MKKYISRVGQAISKLFFCLRVAGDTKTFLRLLLQSKMHFDKPTAALAYYIRFLSVERIIYLRTYAGDIRMFYELFWERIYWLPPTVLATPLVIVDAGANIGMAALYFSIVYPQARIYCIEPDAANFKLLQKNLGSGQERITLFEAALYDRDGEVGLAMERWAYNSKIDEHGDCQVLVSAVTLDTILDRFQLEQIDLLKIDIEGAEDKLFSGETTWLSKVKMILIEVHTPDAIGPIRSRLTENGFHWQLWGGSKSWDAPRGGGSTGSCSLFLASRVEIVRLANS